MHKPAIKPSSRIAARASAQVNSFEALRALTQKTERMTVALEKEVGDAIKLKSIDTIRLVRCLAEERKVLVGLLDRCLNVIETIPEGEGDESDDEIERLKRYINNARTGRAPHLDIMPLELLSL